MITVDQYLLNLVNVQGDILKRNLPHRDVRVLQSLAKSVKSDSFITENQSRLLVKILTEHLTALKDISEEIVETLQDQQWSLPFKPVDTTKKMSVGKLQDEAVIVVEFAYSAAIRKKMMSLQKTISGLTQTANGKVFHADLTEKNVINLIDALVEFGFEIEEKLHDFYQIIKSWNEVDINNQFLLTNIVHDNFQKHITSDLGINTSIDENIINDRSVRYQYFVEKSEKNPENLTEKIAYRKTTKVWVNKKDTELDEIVESLIQLKRFPLLVVFDPYDPIECGKNLRKISEILEKNGVTENIGIYFRMDNSENGKEFNQFISNKEYNSQLTSYTQVVGVQSGKIPKFLLKSDWKPMSVISIGTTLRHSKTAVYASCCDLIISYTDKEPIFEPKILWE